MQKSVARKLHENVTENAIAQSGYERLCYVLISFHQLL